MTQEEESLKEVIRTIATQTGQPIDVVALEVNKLITSLMPRFTADELREKLEEKENSQPTITGEKVERMLEIHAKQRLIIKGTGTGATPYNLNTITKRIKND